MVPYTRNPLHKSTGLEICLEFFQTKPGDLEAEELHTGETGTDWFHQLHCVQSTTYKIHLQKTHLLGMKYRDMPTH